MESRSCYVWWFLYLCHFSVLYSPVTCIDNQYWGEWSPCSQTCDIGTRSRKRLVNNGKLQETEEEYCKLQYCPDDWISCDTTSVCYSYYSSSRIQCTNSICVCNLRETGYNAYNCFPEVGNCVIRENPQTALGYRDPLMQYNGNDNLYSCTTNDNLQHEVHVIGIYGDECYDTYKVTVLPRGPVTKPIILVLTSYETTHWVVDASVPLYKVLYGGWSTGSTLTIATTSRCDFKAVQRTDLEFGYGKDTGGGRTLQLLTQLSTEYGPITSFTGYYSIISSPISHIVLKVGGSPLAVLPQHFVYNMSDISCPSPSPLTPPQTTPAVDISTTAKPTVTQSLSESWSTCSKSCDIGIRKRIRLDSSTSSQVIEEEYCNMQYCPDDWFPCDCKQPSPCYPAIPGGRGKCRNSRCQCTLSTDGYNINNCFPEIGNCSIREHPPTALGYKDPTRTYRNNYPLNSCTTNDNSHYEVHLIGIYGDRNYNTYEIYVRPRGPVTKPIILVLTSYETTNWIIDTSVYVDTVLYGGYGPNVPSSTLQKATSSYCGFNSEKRTDLDFGFGSDTGGGLTVRLIRNVENLFGPITSFTGYYELNSSPSARIVLKVGGSPLAVNPQYDHVPSASCSQSLHTTSSTSSSSPVTTKTTPMTPTDSVIKSSSSSPIPSTTTPATSITQPVITPPPSPESKSNSIAIIAGASAGSSIITLIVMSIVIYVIYKRRQKSKEGFDKTSKPETRTEEEEHYDEIGYERPTHYQELENIRPAPNVYDRLGKPKESVSYIYLS